MEFHTQWHLPSPLCSPYQYDLPFETFLGNIGRASAPHPPYPYQVSSLTFIHASLRLLLLIFVSGSYKSSTNLQEGQAKTVFVGQQMKTCGGKGWEIMTSDTKRTLHPQICNYRIGPDSRQRAESSVWGGWLCYEADSSIRRKRQVVALVDSLLWGGPRLLT